VNKLQADSNHHNTTKEALDLLEAIKFASNKRGSVNWDEDLVNQIVDILKTHPVSRKLGSKQNKTVV
jgi:hypothetical protein